MKVKFLRRVFLLLYCICSSSLHTQKCRRSNNHTSKNRMCHIPFLPKKKMFSDRNVERRTKKRNVPYVLRNPPIPLRPLQSEDLPSPLSLLLYTDTPFYSSSLYLSKKIRFFCVFVAKRRRYFYMYFWHVGFCTTRCIPFKASIEV